MSLIFPCLLGLCHGAAVLAAPLDDTMAPPTGNVPVREAAARPAPAHVAPIEFAPQAVNPEAYPLEKTTSASGKAPLFKGGKLLLANGISTVEGSSGGGIARWATIAGREVPGGIGISGHATAIELGDFGWRSYGVAIGIGDRLERMFEDLELQAEGAAPLVTGEPFPDPETRATAIRIGNPASWSQAEQARDDSGGRIEIRFERTAGVVAVVGLAVRLQAGLVLPGLLRRGHGRDHAAHRQEQVGGGSGHLPETLLVHPRLPRRLELQDVAVAHRILDQQIGHAVAELRVARLCITVLVVGGDGLVLLGRGSV